MIVLLVLCKMGKPSLLGVAWCHSGGADVSDATPRNQDPSASDVASAWWSRVWRVWCQQSSVTWRHSGVGGAGVDWCRANTLKLDGARHIRGATGCCSCILEVFWGGHPGGIPYRSRGGVKIFYVQFPAGLFLSHSWTLFVCPTTTVAILQGGQSSNLKSCSDPFECLTLFTQ